MLLTEYNLLFEAFEDERNLIFDKPDLINAAKQCFVSGGVTCHAVDLTRFNQDSPAKYTNIEMRKTAISNVCPKEYTVFANTVKALVEKIKYAERTGNRKEQYALFKQLNTYRKEGIIPAVKPYSRELKVERLFPYSQNKKDGSIACVYIPVSETNKYKVIVNTSNNVLVTVYQFHDADLLRRAIEFESLELLKLEFFGTLDVQDVDLYSTIKTLDYPLLTTMKKDKLMAKFFKSIGVIPQVKQQVIRKFEEELRTRQQKV